MLFLYVNYIVSGGAGYLGAHLVTLLIEEGHSVTVFDNLPHGSINRLAPEVGIVHVDISSEESLRQFRTSQKIDGLFHLAAKKSVSESMTNPLLYEKVNVIGTKNILDFCVNWKIENIVLTSSAAVYGSLEKLDKISESDPTDPISPYGLTKLRAEEVLSGYVNNGLIKGIALRCFNLTGARNGKMFDFQGENVIPILLRAINQKRFFQVFGSNLSTPDGTCVRDYIHVADAALAHLLAMKKLEADSSQTFHAINISSGVGVSLLELIAEFELIIGEQIEVEFQAAREGDTQVSIGDKTKANLILGWVPQHKIQKIVSDSWEANLSNN